MAEKETGGAVGRKFYVEMGAFAPKLAEQEVAQFLTAEEIDRFQLMADSLTVVIVHGLVPTVAGNRGRDKLAKAIIKALRPTQTPEERPAPASEVPEQEYHPD